MSKWSEYYEKRVGDTYPIYCMYRYGPFIAELEREIQPGVEPHNWLPINFREEGCGIGTISKILLWRNEKRCISLTDHDHEILDLCRKNLKLHLNICFNLSDVINQQYRDDLYPNVTFSHGLLEHLDNGNIESVLERQKEESMKVVHYVPTDGYKKQSFGDERLLPYKWWVNTWEPTRYELFNEGKDLILVWETL